jgi:hypothetical protein
MASFVLTYDVGTSLAIHEQLAAFVKANRHVTQWAQPHIGCFLLKSDTHLYEINASFAEFFAGKTQYLIAVVKPDQTAGLLPQAIWTWFNQPDLPKLGGGLDQFLGLPSASGQ